MIRFQARTFFSSPGHMLKIHFAKKRMGKNIKHGCNSDRRNPPPCIWGHHYQLDDNLVGQLTTSRDIFASQNDGPSRPNSRTSRAPSMGSLVKILPLIKYFFLQIMNFWYRKRLFLKHRNKQDLYLIERWIAVSAVGLARGALTGHLFNRKHRRYNLQLQFLFFWTSNKNSHLIIFSSYYVAQSDGTYGNYRGRGERRKVTDHIVPYQLNTRVCCVLSNVYKTLNGCRLVGVV